MAIVSFLACFISLHLFSPYSTVQILLISLLTGIVSSLSEMASKGGMDTVTVPFANLMVLALISFHNLNNGMIKPCRLCYILPIPSRKAIASLYFSIL